MIIWKCWYDKHENNSACLITAPSRGKARWEYMKKMAIVNFCKIHAVKQKTDCKK